MNRDSAALVDIEGAARLVTEFVEGLDETAFLEDVRTRSAVLHQLLEIGEATKRLSPEFREENTSVPWKRMAGTRDKLIHGYNEIDLHEVWKTVTHDVPGLLLHMGPLLPRRED